MTFTAAAYFSSAVPGLALIAIRRRLPREYMIVMLACATSLLIGTSVSLGRGVFPAAHVLIGVQAMLFVLAMTTKLRHLLVASVWLAVSAAVAPSVMIDDPRKMVLVSLAAIPLIVWHLWGWDHPLKWSVGVYAIIAGVLSAWMVQYYPHDPRAFNSAFVVYQLARFTSFALFAYAACRHHEERAKGFNYG